MEGSAQRVAALRAAVAPACARFGALGERGDRAARASPEWASALARMAALEREGEDSEWWAAELARLHAGSDDHRRLLSEVTRVRKEFRAARAGYAARRL